MFVLLFVLFFALPAHAEITVVDDMGRSITLAQPAKRIISLAPHVTELLYAAGGGEKLKAVVTFSDFPPAAKTLPIVGSYDKFDLEAIIAQAPDLIVAWHSGNPKAQVEQLIKLGFKVYISEPRELDDVAKDIRQLGVLLATEKQAEQSASQFLHSLQSLRQQYAQRTPVRVFYQVWHQPLFTVNDQHLISKVIHLCGGVNVFGNLQMLSSQISVEAVLQQNPQAIFYGSHETREDWSLAWLPWKNIQAVANHHLYGIHADLMVRHTPRILLGAKQMCGYLDQVRAHAASGN